MKIGKKRNKNPRCNKCYGLPMTKKGITKPSEKRFRCKKCGAER